MQRFSMPLAALACAALLGCHSGVGGHLSEGDMDQIRKVTADAARTLAAPSSDAAAYARLLYAEVARVLPPNGPAVQGRDAVVAALASAGVVQEFRPAIVALEGRNDLAYAQGTYEMSLLPPGASEPFGDKGKYVCIWKKQKDGTWKVAVDIWNSDLAVPAPKAASGPTPAGD